MIRIVFASCLLLIVTSCSGIAGLAFTAVSTAKSTYDGYKYIDKNFSKKEVEKEDTGRQWYQVHDEGIWYGDYFLFERKNHRIYGNPRDKETLNETIKPSIR